MAILASVAALSLAGCSSSDDVVAVLDEPSAAPLPSGSAGGRPLPTIVQSTLGPTPTPGAPAPAGSPLPPPISGSSAAFGAPPAPSAPLGDVLIVIATLQSPPVADAARWPLDVPLQQYFPPEQRAVMLAVPEPDAQPLRELGAGYGLGVGQPPVLVPVEDDAGDQFELVLSEE